MSKEDPIIEGYLSQILMGKVEEKFSQAKTDWPDRLRLFKFITNLDFTPQQLLDYAEEVADSWKNTELYDKYRQTIKSIKRQFLI
jgi:hypothetical protein